MVNIENATLSVNLKKQGAELAGVYNKQSGLEYLWQAGDPWPKQSPVLFPIVGTLRNDTYEFEGKAYHLSRHGFAREMEFDVESQSNLKVTFLLESNENTLIDYPFDFELRISYELVEDRLTVAYQVRNTGLSAMFFSIGAHPAFNLPLEKNAQYEDYYLEFEKAETTPRWPITSAGLISQFPQPYLQEAKIIALNKSLFLQDAIVFKNLQSTSISLRSRNSSHGITMHFAMFPFFGIWAAKNADFVCLEPWCGIADSEHTSGRIEQKEGIRVLQHQEVFERSWSLTCY